MCYAHVSAVIRRSNEGGVWTFGIFIDEWTFTYVTRMGDNRGKQKPPTTHIQKRAPWQVIDALLCTCGCLWWWNQHLAHSILALPRPPPPPPPPRKTVSASKASSALTSPLRHALSTSGHNYWIRRVGSLLSAECIVSTFLPLNQRDSERKVDTPTLSLVGTNTVSISSTLFRDKSISFQSVLPVPVERQLPI